jgi:hypothetical protein
MKVTVKQQLEEFKPVTLEITLEITLESKEELEAMYRVIDFAPEIGTRFKCVPIEDTAYPIFKELRKFCIENNIETDSEKLENK